MGGPGKCSRSESVSVFHRFTSELLRPMVTTVLSLILIALVSTNAIGASVEISWDPSPSAPDGYMVLIRVEGSGYNYDAPVWIGAVTDCQIEGLIPGTTYYMVVRAFIGAEQSGDSNEISYTPATDQSITARNDNSSISDDHQGIAAVRSNDSVPIKIGEGPDKSNNIASVSNLKIVMEE